MTFSLRGPSGRRPPADQHPATGHTTHHCPSEAHTGLQPADAPSYLGIGCYRCFHAALQLPPGADPDYIWARGLNTVRHRQSSVAPPNLGEPRQPGVSQHLPRARSRPTIPFTFFPKCDKEYLSRFSLWLEQCGFLRKRDPLGYDAWQVC